MTNIWISDLERQLCEKYYICIKVVVTFYLRKRNEFLPFPAKKPGLYLVDLLGQPIRSLAFGGKWLEFISQSQIQGDYNFRCYYHRIVVGSSCILLRCCVQWCIILLYTITEHYKCIWNVCISYFDSICIVIRHPICFWIAWIGKIRNRSVHCGRIRSLN